MLFGLLSVTAIGWGVHYWCWRVDSYYWSSTLVFVAWGCWLVAAIGLAVALQRSWRYSLLVGLLLISAYPGSYVALSCQGRYEGAVYGLDGPKWYSWAPRGFVDDRRWNGPPMYFYRPLYLLDEWYWHKDVRGGVGPGSYPINP